MSATSTIDTLMAEAFRASSVPRSAEYIAGARAMLAGAFGEAKPDWPPFDFGTTQLDAFLCGMEGARIIWEIDQEFTPVLAGAVRTITFATGHLDAIASALNSRISALEFALATRRAPYAMPLTDRLDVARQALALIEAAA